MFWKRGCDIAVSVGALILLAPVAAIVATAIRLSMGRPVIFRQLRPGLNEKLFSILKFRTMRDARSPDGQPLPDAERLTRLGNVLRRTSLDELPELWNVLKGEMSLVGPRPLLREYLPHYTLSQRRRHEVMPGVTGWAQINGRNALTWEKKFELDLWYVDHRSFGLDLKILWLTALKVLRCEDISQKGHVTMPKFADSGRKVQGG